MPRSAARRTVGVLPAVVLVLLAGVAVAPPPAAAVVLPRCGDGGTPAVVALHDPHFYVDSAATAMLLSGFAGYRVEAGASARGRLWLQVGGFTGGVLGLAPGQPAAAALPALSSGGSAARYLLLTATGTTTIPQSHTVTLFDGTPASGTALCTRPFTYTDVVDTIKALANKVQSVSASVPSGSAKLGDVVTVTVQGDTGTLGAGPPNDPGVLSYTPNALGNFPAGAWRLERTELTISPDGTAPPLTYTDRLYLTGASGPARPYTARYVFRAIGPSAVAAPLKPIQYIASGTQVKHTDIGGTALGALPPVDVTAPITVGKEAGPDLLPAGGGLVTYTLTLTNAASTAGLVDWVSDTLPDDSAYQTGTMRIGGRTVADPAVTGRTMVVQGPIAVPAGGSLRLSYQVRLGATAGTRTNAAVAHFGEVVLDRSADVTASAPATAAVTVVSAAGLSVPSVTVSTAAGNPVTVDPVAGVTAPSGLPLRITALGAPGGGAAVLGADGSVTYNPAAGASGTVSFGYTATDGYSTGSGTVTVNVTPVAAADLYSTGRSTTLTASTGVLANDACTGCTVSTTPVSGPGSGTLTMSGNGTFSYVPAGSTSGTVTFTYRATDAAGRTADGQVTINVADLAPDFAATAYQTAINPLPLQANDPGCGNACRPQAGTAPALGAVVYPTGGGSVVSYTPHAGVWGLDVFAYGVTGNSGGVTTPVTILVGPPAVARQTAYGTAVTGALPAGGSCGRCAYAPGTAPAHGTVTVDASTGASTYRPASGYAGTDSYTYEVRDPVSGLRTTGTVTVTVGPRAEDDTASVLLGATVTGDASANDACPATCTRQLLTGPSSGALTFNPDGTYSYTPGGTIGAFTATYRVTSSVSGAVAADGTIRLTVGGAADDTATTAPGQAVTVDVRANDPCACVLTAVGQPPSGTAAISNGAVVYTPAAGFTGRVTIPYTVGQGGVTTGATLVVTVTPQAVADTVTTVAGTPIEVLPLVNDVCAGCALTGTGQPGSGTASVSGGVVTYTPAGAGTVTFPYGVTDESGSTAAGTITVRVVAAPAVADDAVATVAAAPAVADVLGNDVCAGCAVTITGDPRSGTATVDVRGRAVYLAAPGFSGVDTFRYTATDPGTGAYATAVVTVTVAPSGRDDEAYTRIGVPVDVPVLDNDACTSCTVQATVTAGQVSASVAGGTVTVTPNPGWTGTATVGYTATDPVTGLTATATVTVDVNDARPDSATAAAGAPVAGLDVLANDYCPGCAVTAVTAATFGTASVQGGTVSWQPPAGFAGVASFGYTAGTGGHTVTSTVRILVAPAAVPVAVPAGQAGTVTPVPSGNCPGCALIPLTGPEHGDVDGGGAGFTYTPVPGYQGPDTFDYRVTDPVSKRTVTATALLTVGGQAPPAKVTVSASPVTVAAEPRDGDAVTWRWTVTNSGGQSLRAIGAVAADGGSVACPGATLAVGAGMECTAARTLTQNQIDAGTATAGLAVTATPDTGGDVTDGAPATVTLTHAARLGVTAAAVPQPGDLIGITYTVTNTGNVTLRHLGVVLSPGAIALACAAVTLAPGAGTACTGQHAVTPADRTAGTWNATGTATADPPGSAAAVTGQQAVSVQLTVASPAPSVSPSAPVSPSISPSPSIAPSPSVSPSPSVTPSASATPSVSASPSVSPTASPTVSPTASPTVAPTAGSAVLGVVWFDRNQDGDRDPGEWPLPGVQVRISRVTGDGAALAAATAVPSRTATTAADGGYRFAGLPPGDYRVTAAVSADGFSYSSDSDGDDDWSVTVRTGDAATATAEFAGIGRGAFDGVIYDNATGAPIAGANVTCRWAGLDDVMRTADDVLMTVDASPTGGFTLTSLPYGAYECGGRDPRTGAASAVAQVAVLSADRQHVPLPVGTTDSGPDLPTTGDGVLPLVGTGLLLLITGAVAASAGRRRRL
ncbi:Ig-like domain-containing protein [Catenuloplanes atrovinosus]|uniref:Uncharacterized protein n=1 Tax=Catenuloplanes atrovinosus TaxID=137266 RepID=A0AAE4C9P8_9ACTN|nr:Ig-like domain-containing protein [Catenuloplanes atrovinosus]MDR7276776.1 hypothetical protein [Catenuloplanes atrovinosus]